MTGTAPSLNGRTLAPEHLADLRDSGLSDATIAACGFYTERDPEIIGRQLNWAGGAFALGPCLAIPFDGTYVRFKPSKPNKDAKGRPRKYESPKGLPNRLYVPPATRDKLTDPTVPLTITEGEKKAAKADQEGIACVALVGTEGWSVKRPKDGNAKPIGPRVLIPDMDAIAFRGRRVFVVFDSDAIAKKEVRQAARALADALAARGADVRIVKLPHGDDDEKVGLDDYLITHTADELRALMESAEPPQPSGMFHSTGARFSNFYTVDAGDGDQPKPAKVGFSAAAIASRLRAMTDNWPKRVERLLFVPDGHTPHYLESVPELFAWIGRQLPQGDDNALQWANGGAALVPKGEFFAHLQQTGDVFKAVEAYPHFPELPGHFYLHPELKGGDGAALDSFLTRFRPESTNDGELLKAFFLTLVAGVPPGQRPAFLITAEEGDRQAGRGVGKTSTVRFGAQLVGGHLDIKPGDGMADIITRILSAAGRSKRVLLIDNVKSLKFSCAELEGFITEDTISGRQLFVGEGSIPNVFTVALTINGATLSRDMAQRCVIVKLARPNYTATWEDETAAFVAANRWALLGDLVAILKRSAEPLARYSRWAAWERLVLARLQKPATLQSLIEERQGDVDDDSEEADLVRGAIRQALESAGVDPERQNVLIPSSRMAEIVNGATGEKRPTNKVSAYLKTLQLPELRKSNRGCVRGWLWSGPQAGAAGTLEMP
jgi:hypothetical protein